MLLGIDVGYVARIDDAALDRRRGRAFVIMERRFHVPVPLHPFKHLLHMPHISKIESLYLTTIFSNFILL